MRRRHETGNRQTGIVPRRRSIWPRLCNLTSAAVVVLLAGMPVIAQVDEATRRAAEQGLATAQLNLGVAYTRGNGVPQNHRKAVGWFRLAAEQGDAGAQYNLGVAYTHGKGVPQDHREAIRWFRLASATQGLPGAAAQNNLGVAYTRGEGVPQDYQEAARWFRLAAEQGFAEAQFRLGLAYSLGNGVPQDYVSAHVWMNLSAASGHELAREGRDMVASMMTRAQIAEAQARARDWRR